MRKETDFKRSRSDTDVIKAKDDNLMLNEWDKRLTSREVGVTQMLPNKSMTTWCWMSEKKKLTSAEVRVTQMLPNKGWSLDAEWVRSDDTNFCKLGAQAADRCLWACLELMEWLNYILSVTHLYLIEWSRSHGINQALMLQFKDKSRTEGTKYSNNWTPSITDNV